jgi:hypothetical protein
VSNGEVTERTDPRTFAVVLGEAAKIAEAEEIPYAIFGSIASAHWGRPAPSGDIDLFVRDHDARRLHAAFGEHGFELKEENPKWLLKATKDVLVDIIFKVRGDIYFDEEMQARAVETTYLDQRIRVLSAEDALVIEAISNEYETPDHWFNALGILAKQPGLDWEYLLRRAQLGARRLLALLVYAQSTDIPIPNRYVRDLYRTVYEQEA